MKIIRVFSIVGMVTCAFGIFENVSNSSVIVWAIAALFWSTITFIMTFRTN